MVSEIENRNDGVEALPEDGSGSLGQRFLARFYRATRAINVVVGGELTDEFGLELRDYMVLANIIKGHRYPSAIARRLHANKFVVSRILQKLTELGLVDRQIDDEDSRRVLLRATEAGLELRARALSAMQDRMAPLLAELGAERAEALIGSLELIGDHFAAETSPRAEPSTRAEAPPQAQASSRAASGASADGRDE